MAIKFLSPATHSSGIPLENAIISTGSTFRLWKMTREVRAEEEDEKSTYENIYYLDFTKFLYLNQAKYDAGTCLIQENKRIEIPYENLNNITAYIYDDIKAEHPGVTYEDC